MDKVVRLWDWRRHELLLTLTDCGAVRALAVSPDGKRLATAADDLTIRLWNLERGMQIMTVGRHTGPITDLAFSPDGSTIASTSQDMTLSLWESGPPHAGLDKRFTGSVGHRLGMIE
jgi:WD40 repeat protein